MSYKAYDNYKNSGIKWIGDIPKDWEVIKSKHCFKLNSGYAFKSSDFVDEGACLIRIGDIVEGSIDLDNCKKLPLEYSQLLTIESGDVLIALTGATIGKIGQVPNTDVKMLLNQRVGKLSSKFSNYYKYLLCSDFIQAQIRLIAEGSAQENISNDDIGNFFILDVDDETKLTISNYLDKKTLEIDENIAKNKELISLLEEKKVSLINQVVTKGLDPNVHMKDSKVNWASTIPNSWDVVLAKRFCKIETGGTPKRENLSYWENGTINWMTSGEVNQEIISETKNKITEDGLNNSNAHLLPKNAIVMALSGQGQTKGRVAILDIKTCCSQSVGAFICDNKNIYFKYLFYYFKSRYYDIRGLVGDNLRDGLSLSIIGNIPVLLPPFEEQISISKFLDDNIPNINDTILKIEENIKLLEEYKNSLIHHVVTGKIDVRDEI